MSEAPKGLKNLLSKAVDIKCEPNQQEMSSRQPKERKKSEKVSGDRSDRSEPKESKTKETEKSEKKKAKKSRDREREKSHEKSREKISFPHEEISKSRKIDSVADSSVKRPEKRKLSGSSISDFSKRKIADSRSDDSAQLLRPTKEKSKLRNPALDLIARHRESGNSKLVGPRHGPRRC